MEQDETVACRGEWVRQETIGSRGRICTQLAKWRLTVGGAQTYLCHYHAHRAEVALKRVGAPLVEWTLDALWEEAPGVTQA